MKNIFKYTLLIGFSVLPLLLGGSSSACQFIQQGNPNDNYDCGDLFKTLYVQGQKPDLEKVKGHIYEGMFARYDTPAAISFLNGRIVIAKNETRKWPASEPDLFSEHDETPAKWGDRELYVKNEYSDSYLVRQNGHYLIGCVLPSNASLAEMLSEPEKYSWTEQFAVFDLNQASVFPIGTNPLENLRLATSDAVTEEMQLANFYSFLQLTPPKQRLLPLIDFIANANAPERLRLMAINEVVKLNEPRANSALVKILSSVACSDAVADRIIESYPGEDQAFQLAAVRALTSPYKGSYAALMVVKRLRITQALLPLIDFLDLISTYQSDEPALVVAIEVLGDIGSSRALEKLRPFLKHANQKVQVAAEEAIEKIENISRINGILEGKPGSIAWGKRMIMTHNGSKREIQLKILTAFKKVKTTHPDLKASINTFLKTEIDSGFHDYDSSMLDALEKALE